MPIVAADIKKYLSGGVANTNVDLSLGGAISTTEITDAALHNLFDQVSGAESTDGDTEYRCFYVKNTHGTITYENAKVFIQTNTPASGSTIAIALAGEGLNVTAEVVANESTAPVGEVFTAPATEGAGLVLGNMAPGQVFAIWVRRVISAAAAAYNSDSVILRVTGETAA